MLDMESNTPDRRERATRNNEYENNYHVRDMAFVTWRK